MKKITLLTGGVICAVLLSGCMGTSKNYNNTNEQGGGVSVQTPGADVSVGRNGINVSTPEGTVDVGPGETYVSNTVNIEDGADISSPSTSVGKVSVKNNDSAGKVSTKSNNSATTSTSASSTTASTPAAVPGGVDLSKEKSCKSIGGNLYAEDGYGNCKMIGGNAYYDFDYKDDECKIIGGNIYSEGKASCKYNKKTKLEGTDNLSNCKIDLVNKTVIYDSPVFKCEMDAISGEVKRTVK